MASINGAVRRVVTAQAPGEASRVFSDGPVPGVHRFGDAGPTLMEVWRTFATPSVLRWDDEEPAAGPVSLSPPKDGHLFRIVDIPPGAGETADAGKARALFEQMGEAHAATHTDHDLGKSGLMHRTETLDYGIVLEGEITLVLDTAELVIRAGEVVIQRGSNHAWSNRSGQNCRMAFFMIDATHSQT